MGFCPTFAVFLTTAALMMQVSGSVHQDPSSIVELRRHMDLKFAELFQRLDRLELKLNRILEKDDGSHGKLGTVGADSNDGSPEGTNNEVTIEPPHSPLNHQNSKCLYYGLQMENIERIILMLTNKKLHPFLA